MLTTSIITSTRSTVDPVAGSTLDITATCSTGRLIGGGGRVTTTDPVATHAAYLSESRPSGTASWMVIGRVGAQNLTGGALMTVSAYAICAI
jgi:hypothetical protein